MSVSTQFISDEGQLHVSALVRFIFVSVCVSACACKNVFRYFSIRLNQVQSDYYLQSKRCDLTVTDFGIKLGNAAFEYLDCERN